MWAVVTGFLSPRYWLTWLWTDKQTADEGPYFIGRDNCRKCNRFLSWHSRNNRYCSFHNVTWAKSQEKITSYHLFKSSFEMWLRSRCGGDMDEEVINTNLLTLSSYLDFARINSQSSSRNLYDFCDDVFCDYRLVCEFLLDMRLQAKENPDKSIEKHTPTTEMRICEALHRFIEFRKFQLPIKGIIENRYSATERLLENYKAMLLLNHIDKITMMSRAITRQDIELTVNKFLPQYDIIINFFNQCQSSRSMENGCDIEFATSFLCAYLYSIMPEHISMVHMVRVRDLCLDDSKVTIEYSGDRLLTTELSQYVSCRDLPSPVIASACINKLQKALTLDVKTNAIVQAYITFIRPRITKSNDYLLLSSTALGLTPDNVEERIVTLVYRVTGKVTSLVDRFESEEPTTPRRTQANFKVIPRPSSTKLKRVRFSRVISRKLVKRYAKGKLKARRKLLLDLTGISN